MGDFLRLILLLTLSIFLIQCGHKDWKTANRDSAGIAPKPEEEDQAVVQVYIARTFNWHRFMAGHSWIAFKEKGAKQYEVFHVVGWAARNGGDAIRGGFDIPDRNWYGSKPTIVNDVRGAEAEKAIPKIREAIKEYPYPNSYRMYPGPNSNTFVSYILRRVDELKVELPPIAIGKDWINDGDFLGYSESGTGGQISIFGLLGLTLGLREGIEVNLLGLSLGIDFLNPALKLPGFGRLGFTDGPIYEEPSPAE